MPDEPLISILLIEDSPADSRLATESLKQAASLELEVFHAASLAEAEETLAREGIGLMVLDLNLPDSQGLETVSAAKSLGPGVPVVVLTGVDDEDMGRAALQHGAQDYLVKGTMSVDALWRSIRYAIERHRVGEELRRLNQELEERVKARTSELRGTVARLRDEVSERQRTEQALAEEKERLAITLQSIREAVITADVSGRIAMINGAAEQLTGWPEGEVAGHEIDDILSLASEAASADPIDPVAAILCRGEKALTIPVATLVNRHGDSRLVSGSCSAVGLPGRECLGVVVVLRDITEERKRDEEIQRADKLDSLGILAGGIAHDFNNFLTGIVGNLSLARTCVESGTELYDMIADAEKACQHAHALTGQLLTFAKGGAPLREAQDVRPVVEAAGSFATSGLGAACHYHFQDDLWLASIDAGQITQVIGNLVINADHAMPTGGRIDVTGANVVLQPDTDLPLPPGRYLRISVSDSGVGIPPRFLSRVFEPYFTTKSRGSGLGLASAYAIIQKHDGHMAVESEPGKGSIFTLYLPAAECDAGETAPAECSVVAGEGRVLVMDDDSGVRRIAERLLKRLGYAVDVVSSGEEAVSAFRHAAATGRPYDVVILDLTVREGMGGEKTLIQLRGIDPGVRAVVSSGYSDSAAMARFEEYGFVGAVAKPWQASQLSAAVAAAVTRTSE